MIFPPPISVIIATFGNKQWMERSDRAFDSAQNQTQPALDIRRVHGETLAAARNEGAKLARGEWLIFLDADDELDPGYIEAMTKAVESTMHRSDYRTFLYQPATLGIVDGVPDPEPVLIPQRPLNEGNFMVIGTMMSRRIFDEVGGFEEWDAFEDWDLFCRCHNAGAGFYPVPEAIYRVHVNPKGRNNVDRRSARKLFKEIHDRNFGSSRIHL